MACYSPAAGLGQNSLHQFTFVVSPAVGQFTAGQRLPGPIFRLAVVNKAATALMCRPYKQQSATVPATIHLQQVYFIVAFN